MSAVRTSARDGARGSAGGRGSRIARSLPAVLAVLAGVAAAVALLVAGGGAVGPLVVARVLVRLVLAIAAAGVLGVLAVLTLVLAPRDPRRARLLDAAAGAAALWAVAAGLTALLRYLDTAPTLSAPQFGPGLVAFLEDPALGGTWLVAAIAAAVLTTALVAVRSRRGVALLLPAAGLALVPVATQGAAPGAAIAVARATFSSELVLAVASGAQLGLLALLTLVRTSPVQRRRAAGCAAVSAVVALAAVLLGAPGALADGVPGPVLVARTVLVAVAAGLAVAGRARPGAGLLRSALLAAGGGAGCTAVVAAGSRLEVVQAARVAPAEILTGAPLPPPLSALRLLTAVRPDTLWLVVCVLLLVAHAMIVIALRRRGVRGLTGPATSWTAGVLLLAWLTSGGPAAYQDVLLGVRLAQQAALLLVVPLLLALGAPMRLTGELLPRSAAGSRPLPSRPVVAGVIALGSVLVLLAPGPLRWSLEDPAGADAAVLLTLLAGGLLVGTVLTAPRRVAVTTAVVLLGVEVAGAVAAAAGSGLLLADWYGAMGWGTDALADQRAGVVAAGATLVAATLALLVAVVRRTQGQDVLPGARQAVVERPEEEVPA